VEYEVSGGGTAYLDKQRSLSISTMAYWETHTKKNGEVQFQRTTVHDVKSVSCSRSKADRQVVSARRRQHRSGLLRAVEDDADQMEFGSAAPQLSIPDKQRVFGYGPDITFPSRRSPS
jgi:hypothetical protein